MIKLTKKRKIIYGLTAALLVVMALNSMFIVKVINTYTKNVKEKCVVYIRPGANFSDVIDSVSVHLKDKKSFVKTAEYKDLQTSFKPGRYLFVAGMKNWEIVRIIQNGWESPMKLTLSGNIRSKERMASILGRKLAADSAGFINYFNDTVVCGKYGLKPETFISLFIPNTYEVYWTMTPAQFVVRMNKEYDAFWTTERENKAKALGLSRTDVSTLASIVCEESNYAPEQPTIAGVYLNRLKRGMKLDADPTVKYAWNDPSIKRILFTHLEIDSPYNTYKNAGLPPGPITIPSITGLDAVLNYEQHDYLFFCANANLDGTHKFAKTLGEHNKNAREYQKAISGFKK